MPGQEPISTGEDARYRCAACGNLTRFDVEARRHTRQFIHFSLAGDPTVEDEEVLEEEILAVRCRWCDSTEVESIPRVATE